MSMHSLFGYAATDVLSLLVPKLQCCRMKQPLAKATVSTRAVGPNISQVAPPQSMLAPFWARFKTFTVT